MRIILLFAAVILSLWLPEPAFGQSLLCQPRADVVAGLAREFRETPRGIGVTLTGNIVEILRSDRTFTILVTMPDGMSCLIAAGKDWESIPPPKIGRVM